MDTLMQLINRTHRCFTRYRSGLLTEEGLNGRQQRYILKICENPGVSQDQLADWIAVDKSNVARQLFLLEQAGFITRTTDAQDRRHLLIHPTEKALAVYPKARKIVDDWNQRLLDGVSEAEQAQLHSLMERIALRAAQLADAPKQPDEKGR